MTKQLRSVAEYVSAGLVYLAAGMGFYRAALFGSATFPFDVQDMDYPRFFFLAKWIHRLVIPMWDPHVGFGVPLAGLMGCQTFYPPLYAALLLGGANPSIRVVEWAIVAHIVWGAIGVYTLCRALRLLPPAAFTAGLLFAFGGFFALRIFHGGWVETAAWFPFALAAWVRFLETRRLRFAAWMSAVFLVMMFAGFWQQVMYSMYFTLFWAVWESVLRFVRGERSRSAFLPVAVVILACGAALACDTCELLPTYSFAKDTVRQKLSYEDSASNSLRASDMPAILWAGMFAGKDGAALWNARRVNSGIRDYYPGTVALVLLAYNLVLLIKRPERNQIFLWAALVVFAAASFGASTPVFWFFYKFAPGFSFFRRSSSLYYFPVLAAAVLSAYSLNDILSRAPVFSLRRVARYLLLLSVIPAAIFFLLRGGIESRGALPYLAVMEILAVALFAITRFPARASAVGYVLAACAFTDLYYFHGGQFSLLDRNFSYPQLDRIAQLRESPADPYRVALAPFGAYWDNLGEIVGFENPGGYLIFRQKRYQDYIERIQTPDSPLLAVANARYLLTSSRMLHPSLRRFAVASLENRVQLPSGPAPDPPYVSAGDFPQGLEMFRNTSATPRYYFSSSATVIPDPQKRLDRMSDPTFAIQRAAVLEVAPDVPIDNCANDPVQVLEYTPNAIRLQVVSHGNCLLVAVDSYQSDWRTYTDGAPTPVYIEDSVFRATVIPPGKHSVELKFKPVEMWVGIALSLAFGLALLIPVVKIKSAATQFKHIQTI